jgi:regulator of sigma E protease
MTLFAFLGALGLLIAVHEWGHYRMAVACGVKVETFSIGLGRPLLRWRSRNPYPNQDTEFLICWIPLGGYIKMLEDDAIQTPSQNGSMALNSQVLWKRAAIVAAGPVANLLLAVALFSAVGWLGQFESKPILASPRQGSVAESAGLVGGELVLRAGISQSSLHPISSIEDLKWWAMQQDFSHDDLLLELDSAHGPRLLKLSLQGIRAINQSSHEAMDFTAFGLGGAWSAPVIGKIQPGLAADRFGLVRGDLVLRLDGHNVNDAVVLRSLIRAHGGLGHPIPQVWEVQRPGKGLIRLEVTPDQIEEKGIRIARIGAYVGEAPQQVWVQVGLWDGIVRALGRTSEVIGLSLDMMGRLFLGQASLDNVSGPLAMAEFAGQSASLGVSSYLSYLALISLSLAIFNLLPVPVLDGGHLLYYLYEALTGRLPDARWLDVMQRIGLLILVCLMVFSFFNDLVRLGWIN